MNVMSQGNHNYKPATVISTAEVTAGVESFFSGEDLIAKMQAIPLLTVDADGWPRVSLLSVGEIVFRPGEGFRFCVFQQSHTAANLVRDGRATLSMALEGGIWEVRLRATACDRDVAEGPLAFFKAKIDSACMHAAPYAQVTSGVTFSLNDPSAVLPRWQKQIATARALS